MLKSCMHALVRLKKVRETRWEMSGKKMIDRWDNGTDWVPMVHELPVRFKRGGFVCLFVQGKQG